MSPVIHREQGYLLYFVSYDVASGEPAHVHIGAGSPRPASDAKIWLNPVRIAEAGRFGRTDIQRMVRVVDRHRENLLEAWNDYRNRLQE